MKAEKLAESIEKILERIEKMNYPFSTDEFQEEFDADKRDVVDLLNSMIEVCHMEEAHAEEHKDDEQQWTTRQDPNYIKK